MQKYNKNKRVYEKDQQTIKSFDKFYRKSSKVNVIDKNECEGLSNILNKYVDGTFL